MTLEQQIMRLLDKRQGTWGKEREVLFEKAYKLCSYLERTNQNRKVYKPLVTH